MARTVESLNESLKKPCEVGQYLHLKTMRVQTFTYLYERRWSGLDRRVGRRKDGLEVTSCHRAGMYRRY